MYGAAQLTGVLEEIREMRREVKMEIRKCRQIGEFRQCIDLQREVWQFSDLDIVPLRSFIIAMHSGGMTHGAFDDSGVMAGFAHALPAFDGRLRPYYYSHMLAVASGRRDGGIGRQLKLAQRDHALASGIELITWTFDPLQSRNAYLNLVKLGGVVRRYKVNYYGNASTSMLHRGLETDRLFVEWWVGSERVRQALAGERPGGSEVRGVVEVPREIEEVKREDMAAAQRWQLRIRESFVELLGSGLYCAGFEVDPGGVSRYLFYADEEREKLTVRPE
jgi:predicted GNAT superfamily acetyltransferase